MLAKLTKVQNMKHLFWRPTVAPCHGRGISSERSRDSCRYLSVIELDNWIALKPLPRRDLNYLLFVFILVSFLRHIHTERRQIGSRMTRV